MNRLPAFSNFTALIMLFSNSSSRGTQPITLQRGEQRITACFAFVSSTEFDQLKATVAEFLSKNELEYFESLQFLRRQQSYLLGRCAAKLAVAHYLHEPILNRIEIYPGVFEQPLVRFLTADVPGVSISHCDGLAVALAFPAGHPMALDVERIEAARVPTMKSQMSADELEWARMGEAGEQAMCAAVWTAKEALSKVLKCGMMTPFEILSLSRIHRVEGGVWESLYVNFSQYKCLSWVDHPHVISVVLPRLSHIISGMNTSSAS